MLRLIAIASLLIALTACATPNTPSTPTTTPRPIPTLPPDTAVPATATPTIVPVTPVVLSTLAPTTPTPLAAKQNPFGLMLGPDALGIDKRIAVIKSLGGAYFRPWDVTVGEWDGKCVECMAIEQSGLKVLLTVRANGGASAPTSPPKDLNLYKRTLADILDKRKPELLVVENEESSVYFYTGTPNDYSIEERTACEVAHSKGVKCTNGGLASDEVVLLTWANYADTNRAAQGCAFARRALDAQLAQILCNVRTPTQLPKPLQDDLNKGRALLKIYATTGADYLNFHWYVPDPDALAEAIAFLRSASKLPLMSNEMGQQSDNANTIQPLMQKALDLALPYVIWYSVDSAKARALDHPDGSLRATGQAFKAFMQTRVK